MPSSLVEDFSYLPVEGMDKIAAVEIENDRQANSGRLRILSYC